MMRVSIEIRGGTTPQTFVDSLFSDVRKTFEVSSEIAILAPGTLEQELRAQVKQQRFVDKRG